MKTGRKVIDIIGQRFGRWTVIGLASTGGAGKCAKFLCVCDCGNQANISGHSLRKGGSTRCKICADKERNKKHGMSYNRLYSVWHGMKDRCYREGNISYKYYGAKGIRICDEWKNDFVVFMTWALANGYRADLSIDKKDNNKDYSPENCRWATNFEQIHNRGKQCV
jgi:hypothetical protein